MGGETESLMREEERRGDESVKRETRRGGRDRGKVARSPLHFIFSFFLFFSLQRSSPTQQQTIRARDGWPFFLPFSLSLFSRIPAPCHVDFVLHFDAYYSEGRQKKLYISFHMYHWDLTSCR